MHYQTEEQQIEAIRTFFKKHSNLMWLVILTFALVFMAYRYWTWQQIEVKTQASSLYESMMAASERGEQKNIIAYADKLANSYANTIYGQVANLVMAKYAVQDSNNSRAKKHLETVINKANLPALRQIAVLRLVRVLIEEQDYPRAMKLLKKNYEKNYDFINYELQGDIYVAEKKMAQAKMAYNEAEKIGHKKGIMNRRLELKQQNL